MGIFRARGCIAKLHRPIFRIVKDSRCTTFIDPYCRSGTVALCEPRLNKILDNPDKNYLNVLNYFKQGWTPDWETLQVTYTDFVKYVQEFQFVDRDSKRAAELFLILTQSSLMFFARYNQYGIYNSGFRPLPDLGYNVVRYGSADMSRVSFGIDWTKKIDRACVFLNPPHIGKPLEYGDGLYTVDKALEDIEKAKKIADLVIFVGRNSEELVKLLEEQGFKVKIKQKGLKYEDVLAHWKASV